MGGSILALAGRPARCLPPRPGDPRGRPSIGGNDGLEVVRRLIAGTFRMLRPGGRLVMEIGIGQAGAVTTAAAAHREWEDVTFRPDLHGIARIAVLSRTGDSSR